MRRVGIVLGALMLLLAQAGAALAALSSDDLRRSPMQHDEGVLIESHRVEVEIDDQVAVTRIEQVFFNDSGRVAEGTYVFPLPMGAAVSDLVMWVDGKPVEAKILDAEQARAIYDDIVRRMRDPALLEYVGAGAIQASVFPIQPYSEVKIEIEYGQLLPVEDGLVHYVYPLRTDHLTRRPVERLSISVRVRSSDPISTVYSPSHPIAISREGDYAFRVGYEESYVRPESDFSLYYGLARQEISANLLTYRESAREDGFFTLIITPPLRADADRIIPKDVIIVLDQSGSMHGEKWDQAREAVRFVLENLNRRDRFNLVVFSTGYRIFAEDLQPASVADEAIEWVEGLEALGGTDIDGALSEAMRMADRERSTVVLFLTDGLPTEGETDVEKILDHVDQLAPPNVRIFTFGVGDDVDTFLLDQLSQKFRGAGTYVRPGERVDEEVSSLYSKISAPVLTNVELDVEGVLVEELFPGKPLPDLFAGTQLIIVGRYRDGGPATIRLEGDLDGEHKVYRYEVEFRERAGGEPFIARLWATRKIGALLNAIRLHGEDPELVDSVIRLSIRYGIITPYTSFLITEDDIFSQEGREEAQMRFQADAGAAFAAPSGAAAVNAAEAAAGLAGANAPLSTPAPTMLAPAEMSAGAERYAAGESPVRYVADRTFVWRDGVWVDTLYDADRMTPQRVVFLSDEYFALLDRDPQIGEFLALGERVLFVWEGQAYEIVTE
jgi:Ca-activated chloride channel family protein